MSEQWISMLIGGAGAGGTVISGLLVWWIKGVLSDIKKIDSLTESIARLQASVDGFAGKLESMQAMIHQNNKEIAVLERDLKTQWSRYEDLSRYVRDKGL